jgi:predicted nucleic acid-binding protein
VTLVLDASVVLAWEFEDEPSVYADRVLDAVSIEGAIVPPVWLLEVSNGLLVGERRRRISAEGVDDVFMRLSALPIERRDLRVDQIVPVLDLAREHRLTAYDASYLELAQREGLPLATEDEDLRAAATAAGVQLVQ